MKSQKSFTTDGRRSGTNPEKRVAGAPLAVTDVVQHGTGRGSRMDLTVGVAGHRVRLTGLPAKHALRYGRIEESAMEQGLLLPYLRPANRIWRKVLSAAMEHARFEPLLEGEEIADAIVAEIRGWLDDHHRGANADDLKAGKVVERGSCLLVTPTRLVDAVRSRMVDDVLPQATIAEAAMAQLGMHDTRPGFPGRPRAWAFPRPLPVARDDGEGGRTLDQRVAAKANGRAEDPVPATAGSTVTTETERDASLGGGGPIHGPRGLRPIPRADSPLRVGSNGPPETASTSPGSNGSIHGPRDSRRISRADSQMGAGSSGPPEITFPSSVNDGAERMEPSEPLARALGDHEKGDHS